MFKELITVTPEITANNPCLSTCNGACCRDMLVGTTDTELQVFTRNATRTYPVKTRQEFDDLRDQRGVPRGIASIKNGPDSNLVAIIGPCPNLQEDSSCGVYDHRAEACKKLQAGDAVCNLARRIEGLHKLKLPIISPLQLK